MHSASARARLLIAVLLAGCYQDQVLGLGKMILDYEQQLGRIGGHSDRESAATPKMEMARKALLRSKKYAEFSAEDGQLKLEEITNQIEQLRKRIFGQPLTKTQLNFLDQSGMLTEVAVVGDWSNWLVLHQLSRFSRHDWYADLSLPPGEHKFKFLVDGHWEVSITYDVVDDTVGTTGNNIFTVEEADDQAQVQDAQLVQETVNDLQQVIQDQIDKAQTGSESQDTVNHMKDFLLRKKQELEALSSQAAERIQLLTTTSGSEGDEETTWSESNGERSGTMQRLWDAFEGSSVGVVVSRVPPNEVKGFIRSALESCIGPIRLGSLFETVFPALSWLRSDQQDSMDELFQDLSSSVSWQDRAVALMTVSCMMAYSLASVQFLIVLFRGMFARAEHLPCDISAVGEPALASYHYKVK